MLIDDKLWAGSEESLRYTLKSSADVELRASANDDDDDDKSGGPRLLEMDGPIATIKIHGPLVNSDSPWLAMFGMTGYPEIRDALVVAAENPDVKHILLDLSTGGGSVSGVADTANLIRNIHSTVKPVTAFAENAASAGYWLASSAGDVVATKTSMIGSIGVIATHYEYSEQMKKEGIGVTVVRAGKEKARANSNEPLDEKGLEQIQQAVDATYKVFVEHVADMRGKSYEYADRQMADGKEFIGQMAMDVDLVDAITPYDTLVAELKEKYVAQQAETVHNSRKNTALGVLKRAETNINEGKDMGKKTLNATLAAEVGVELDAAAPVEGAAAEASAAAEQPVDTVHVEASAPVEPAPVEPAPVEASAQSVLLAQIKEKDAALLSASVELAKVKDKLAEIEATSAAMTAIVAKSVNTMSVAMGGSALNLEGATPSMVLAEHQRVSVAFKAAFPVGGVAATGAKDEAENKSAVDPRHLARVNAVRFNK